MDTIRTLAEIKTFFETGDKPTQQEFYDTFYTLFDGMAALPKRFKALITEIAPVTKTNGTVTIGSIWVLNTFAVGDDFSNWELLSGTVNTDTSVYRATSTAPTDWSNGSEIETDGKPFVSSLDADDAPAPFIDTMGTAVTFEYVSAGTYQLKCVGAFPSEEKVFIQLGKSFAIGNGDFYYYWIDADTIEIKNGVGTDGKLWQTSLLIEVFP